METNDIPTDVSPSDWQPITNKHDLAVLGKLGEEVGELVSAIFRCIIQGLDESEPVTHKVNRKWLEDEIADVEAMLRQTKSRFDLHFQEIERRTIRKFAYKDVWFEALQKQENQK